MKNFLIIVLSNAYFCLAIASEGPRTRSMTRQWRATRDAILAKQQSWAVEQFNEEERERLYQINKAILTQNVKITRQNAEVFAHGSFSSWFFGALCFGISLTAEDSNVVIQPLAQCAACSCGLLGLAAAIMACKECQAAREETGELAQMQSKKI